MPMFIFIGTAMLLNGMSLVPYPTDVKVGSGTCEISRAAADAAVRGAVTDTALPSEGYRLSVSPAGVRIATSTAAGAFYAGRTLKQLLAGAADGRVPAVEIADSPKFPWRGLHFDDARHFFGKDEVLKLLETMADYKLNVLHWHLVDDEGWRIPIPGYPQLTAGARPVENRLNFRDLKGEGSYGPFAYTREELEEIVRRAAALHIRIVPELEIPGHSRALLKACPEFSCSPTGAVGKVDNVCCVGKAETIGFFERALDEVMAIFPGEVIHIGGDECDRRGWTACKDCRARMEREGVRDAAELQSRVTAHFARHLSDRGRRLIGWDEIAEGGLPSGAMVMSWRGAETGIAAARHGHDVVMTPLECCYFDYTQCVANDPEKYPFNWTVHLPLAKVYGFDPLKDIPVEHRRHILGAQGNNWSEMSCTGRELEWKIWPRAAAMAEVLWSYPAKRDFEDFACRMEECRKALVGKGVNAAPVRVHRAPEKGRGELKRTVTAGGETLRYVCGDVQATLTLDGGKLSLTTDRDTRDFPYPFKSLDVLDVGSGAILVTGHRKGRDLVATVLFDGEFVSAKDCHDYCQEPSGLPDGIRPYEFVWANRTADEFPPIARLEKADGWTVVCSNAEAKLETATNRALFGRSVVRLNYRATGEKPLIRLLPAKPVALPDAFDTVTLWVYGNNIRGEPFPGVMIAADFTEANGAFYARALGGVSHKEWHLMTGIGGMRPYGAKFTGFTVKGGVTNAWQSIGLTSLCAYVDPKRPDTTRAIDRASLPFPIRKETVIPPVVELREKLEFRLPKDPLDWSDLAFRYGGSEWIPLARGGGLFPHEKAVGAKVEFRKVGNSLVCEIAQDEPGVREVRFGVATFPGGAELLSFPYYTYRYFNQWDNPVLKNTECGMDPCFFRPKVAAAGIGGKTLFVGATFDWYVSGASGPYNIPRGGSGDSQLSSALIYLPRTDTSLNPCCERFVWTFAEDIADVFPAIPNPKSPYMKEAGAGSWVSFHARDRAKDAEYWRAVKGVGLNHVIITDHESGWRDGNESFTFRTRTAPGKGGDEGQREYARILIDELGFRYGPYNNFTDYAPVNGHWSIDHAGRFGDGSLIPAWNRCYSPKSTWGARMCEILAPEIQGKFGFNTAYCDVHTCVTPWARVDYDVRSPGAGTFSQVFYDYGAILLEQKGTWKGPVYSEGCVQWLYSGLADGSYAQDEDYDFMKDPWYVDFDLRRMHDLSCNFGMGAPYMFYHGADAGIRKTDPQLWIDRFTAATLAFGHPGYFVSGRDPADLELEKESYYPVQAIAAKYTQAKAVAILYAAADGSLHPSSAAFANGAARRSQVKVTYSDGTVVAVNGNVKDNFKVEVGGVPYDLPPNGWRAETVDRSIVSFNGLEGGTRVKYAKSPEYEWRKGQ